MPGRVRTARPRAQLLKGRRDWYRIENSVGAGPANIHIYSEIGYWGITAEDFVAELNQINAAEIHVHINSPGGEIFDGIAIANALAAHPAKVTSFVDSLAASIASVIALAGDRVVMAPRSQMMIHDGSGFCIGNAADMREMAVLLDRQSDNIASVYAEKAGGTVEEWRAVMTAEQWYSAEEAVAAGLADEVSSSRTSPEENSLENSWDLSIFRYPSREAAPAPTPVNTAAVADPVEESAPADAMPADVTEDMLREAGVTAGQRVTQADVDAARAAAAAEEADTAETEATPADTETAPETQSSPWAAATAHLIQPATAPADAFRRLTEALLCP